MYLFEADDKFTTDSECLSDSDNQIISDQESFYNLNPYSDEEDDSSVNDNSNNIDNSDEEVIDCSLIFLLKKHEIHC